MIDLAEYRNRTENRTGTVRLAEAPAPGSRVNRNGYRLEGHRLIVAGHRFTYGGLPPAA